MFTYLFKGCSFRVVNSETMNPFEMFDTSGDGAKNGVMQVKMPASAPFAIEVKFDNGTPYTFFALRVKINEKQVRLPEAYFRRMLVRGNEGTDQHLCFLSASNDARKAMGDATNYNKTTIEIDLVKMPIGDDRIPFDADAIENPDTLLKCSSTGTEHLAGGMICTRQGSIIETKTVPQPSYGWKYNLAEPMINRHVKVLLQLVCTASDEEKAKTTTSDYADVRMAEEIAQLEKEFLTQAKVVDVCNLRIARLNGELERAQSTVGSLTQTVSEALTERNDAAVQAKYLKERLDARRTGKPVGNIRQEAYLINFFF